MSYPAKAASYYYKVSYVVFLFGSPNFWIEDLKCSKLFYKIYRLVSRGINVIIPCFIVFELGAFVTQKSLTTKQETDLMIYGISHPILWSYSLILWSHDGHIKNIFSHIISLKSSYNDEEVEKQMIRKSMRDSVLLALSCIMSLALHSVSALLQCLNSEGTFTTVITTWPLVDDTSHNASIARIINNLIWWAFVTRIIASYNIIIVLVTSISYQYVNLQSYFYIIDEIFHDHSLSQNEKEIKYEESFKLGIKLHSSTMQCLDQFRSICQGIFSAQIVFVISMLVFLMTQMMKSERTMVNAAATAITATAVLISTGFFVWNAGDITVEADRLPTAMYCSGWHNCHGAGAIRVRRMVSMAMTHAQKPVVIKGLGIMTFSYRSYLSLVKTSYSVFSVLF